MSLEFEAEVEVDADVQIDIEPEVEVEIDVAPEVEIEVEADVDAEIEVEVEVPVVDVDADLVVESNLAEPIVEVEIGGSSNGAGTVSGGGVCNLVCSILFACFFVGDLITLICLLVSWNYYAQTIMINSHVSQDTANLSMTIAVIGVSCGAVLWGILALCCCRCWKGARGPRAVETTYEVQAVTTYEVGGGANVDDCVEVELEVPQVEVEVELEAPEIVVEEEVNVDIGDGAEFNDDIDVEVHADIELDAGVEVELEVEL